MQVRHTAAALAILAGAAASPLHASELRDALPVIVPAYATSALAVGEPAGLPAREYSFDPAMVEAEDAPEKQSYWPVLYSLLVPGAGEISMGYYKRGVALVALEIAAWTGYFIKHDDGMEQRDAYEAFADANWDLQKWIDDHPCSTLPPSGRTLEDLEACGEATSGSGAWPGYVPYVSKEEDKQHYYENLGKYDWYISGWADWSPLSDPYDQDTPQRDQYRAMREESNDSFDQASAFAWVSVAARAFSLAETAILVRNARKAAEGDGGGMALRARPRGFDGAEVALEVRFR